MKDVNKHINIDKRGKFLYFYLPYSNYNKLIEFIKMLDKDSFYTAIPILSIHGKDEDPHIILSRQILISSYSDPRIINNYLIKQLDQSFDDFGINLENKFYYLILKYTKIEINI